MVKYLRRSVLVKPSVHGDILTPMCAASDSKLEAVVFLGLLRHNEDRLVERAKSLIKKDRAFFQEMFAVKIDGWTPMHACTLRGARKLVKVALKAGVNPNLEMGNPDDLPGGCTPLHLAAHRGDISVMQLLVQHGALINKRDETNHMPLYYALQRGNTLAAKKLLKYGADPSELSREERIYYEEDIDCKKASLSCIPVRLASQRHRSTSPPLSRLKTSSSQS